MTLRVGIIGIGNIGSAHAAAIFNGKVAGMTLAAVCDTDPVRRAWAAEHLPGVAVYAADEDFFAHSGVDAVIVATPHYFHPPLVIEALSRGMHALTEKPAGVSVSAVRGMIAAAEKSGRRFGIMWNQRTSPLYARARALVRDGALGTPVRLIWQATAWYRTQAYYDSGSWRATWDGEGGGVLMNQAPHQLDLMQWIFGMPCAVRAVCTEGRFHRIEVEDDAMLFCRYANGAEALFIASTGENPGTNRLEITGTAGKLVAVPGRLEWWRTDGACEPVHTVEVFSAPESGHAGILNDFSRAVREGGPLLAEGAEGIRELSLCNAAYLSAWTGEEVPLPFDEAEFDRLLDEKRAHSRKKAAESGGGDGEYKRKWSVDP